MSRFYRNYLIINLAAIAFLAANALGVLHWECPIRGVCGIPCPGCGITRGLLALAHLDVAGALAHNWLCLPLALLWLLSMVCAIGDLCTRQTLLEHLYDWAEAWLRSHPAAVIVIVALALAPWLLKEFSGLIEINRG